MKISNKYILTGIRLLLGGLFLYAGLFKINHQEEFLSAIINYGIISNHQFMINLLSIILPWIEITSGVFLLAGIWKKSNALIVFVLLLIFSSAVLMAIKKGLSVDCGCFGFGVKVGWGVFLRNILLLFLSFEILINESV
ncbi:MAG: MauE/DoxX family redox-associated membrane protein [Acidobacteriota bacterium]